MRFGEGYMFSFWADSTLLWALPGGEYNICWCNAGQGGPSGATGVGSPTVHPSS